MVTKDQGQNEEIEMKQLKAPESIPFLLSPFFPSPSCAWY